MSLDHAVIRYQHSSRPEYCGWVADVTCYDCEKHHTGLQRRRSRDLTGG